MGGGAGRRLELTFVTKQNLLQIPSIPNNSTLINIIELKKITA
jgi:hypothetical protein